MPKKYNWDEKKFFENDSHIAAKYLIKDNIKPIEIFQEFLTVELLEK
jgi:hypothetical protein